MTLVLIGKDLVLEGTRLKIEDPSVTASHSERIYTLSYFTCLLESEKNFPESIGATSLANCRSDGSPFNVDKRRRNHPKTVKPSKTP